MRPLRFLLFFICAYLLGFASVGFFLFAAQTLGNVNLVFAGMLFAIVFTFLFSWLYFRKLPELAWKGRAEVIAVWVGFTILLDLIVLLLIFKEPLSSLGMTTVLSYGVQVATLFVTAYITGQEHPTLSSPNLLLSNTASHE